ncbi:ATP-dependent RNA helicase-like protein mrh4 [Calycina marina]|uniref:RNA helicase n=1 Tax=Calycina marina TaxID=1763456 RepID=A0A9P7Z7H7_9HELO|nr:ATP-dependent RNA helicase-like protein mrh4 [Calycina marina]
MLRPQNTQCLLCSFRAARQSANTARSNVRFLSQRAIDRPSRLSLAPARDVKFARQGEDSNSKPARRKQDGPFGGMNQREANIRGIPEKRSPMQIRRSAGGDPRALKEKGPKDRGFRALKMHRALAVVSYGQRTGVKERMAAVNSFEQFPLLESVQESIVPQALTGMTDIRPTPVQKITIPALIGVEVQGMSRRKTTVGEREDFLIAAETGSGKTLSYLIPTINAVKQAETEDADIAEYEKRLAEENVRQNDLSLVLPPLSTMPHPTTGRPRAIILVPTSELVVQVGNLVKAFSHTVKFRSAMISSNFSGKVIRNRLFSSKGIDVVVSTPHLLSSIAESDPNILSRVTHLIVDEADSLLDIGFSPLTQHLIDRAAPSLKQLILCSATIPRSMDTFLRTRFPDIKRLVTPNLHAIPRRVQLGVVEVERDPYQGNKDLACADTIWSIGKAAADHDGPVKGEMDVKRILVFVNKRETTKELADYLVSKGVDAIALNRDTPEERQSEMLASFTSATPLTAPKPELPHPGSLADNQPNYLPFGVAAPDVKKKLPNVKVLVTTDLGSRGIDTVSVRYVILYDVPHSTVDFIHRLGRTGRMGRRGRGIVLVGKNDRRDVVAEVKEGMFKGQALI